MGDDKLDAGWGAAEEPFDHCPGDEQTEAAKQFLREFFRGAVVPDGLSPNDNGRAQWIADTATLLMGEVDTHWPVLVDEARRDAATFDVLSECAARFEDDATLKPPPLAAWAAGVHRGTNRRPRRHGPDPARRYLRNMWIVHAVIFAADFAGLKPTRNEATESASACDLVAEILQELDWMPSLSAKTIAEMGDWSRFKPA